MIATACDDKKIRVFYLSHSESPLKIFTGHTAKVFSVKWSPILDGIFCSSSDDCKILIWDYSRESCIASLDSHVLPVRALLWHTEIPYILLSGSWDSTIRMWDTRNRECIITLNNHIGDVYGLTSHPSKPFVFVSASRDSTIRIWNSSNLFNDLYLSLLVKRPWTEIMNIGTIEFDIKKKCLRQDSPTLLFGRHSKEIKLSIDLSRKDIWLEKLRKFSEYFSSTKLSNLWSLVDISLNKDDLLLDANYYKGIVYWKHITKATLSTCNELIMNLNTTSGILTSQKKIISLEKAADFYLKCGNIQKYCEIMISLNEWERALAIAPGVSLRYWQNLMKKYAKHLQNDNSSKFIPFSLAIGDVEEIVNHFSKHGQYK
jgi:WD repeat-containing protein 17